MFTVLWVCVFFWVGVFLGCISVRAIARTKQNELNARIFVIEKALNEANSELTSKRKECDLTANAATRLQTERDALEAIIDKYRCKTQELHAIESGEHHTWHAVN